MTDSILPDVLETGLKVVFCGTAAGDVSAKLGAYYAGPGNRFWSTLHHTGLTPHRIAAADFKMVVQYGIGLTDIAKHTFGADKVLTSDDFDAAALRRKIEQFTPYVLAFNGKRAAKAYFGVSRVDYGWHTQRIGTTRITVLPSTSGAARGFWDESLWFALAHQLNERLG